MKTIDVKKKKRKRKGGQHLEKKRGGGYQRAPLYISFKNVDI
jgi:hypothetical protein